MEDSYITNSSSNSSEKETKKKVLFVKTVVVHPLKNDAFGIPLGT